MFKDLKVDEWFEEIADGLEFRQLHGIEGKWAELEALFYNVHSSSDDGPNVIISTGDALLSSLTVPHPHVTVSPRRRSQTIGARILESLDNELIGDLGLRQEVEQASLHAYLWGVGALKVGYDSEYGWNPQLEVSPDMPLGLSVSQFDRKGQRIEYSSKVRPGSPWALATPPHDIVVPYGTGAYWSAPWVAFRVVRHIDEVKSDSKYKNTRGLPPSMSMEDFVNSYKTVMKPYRVGRQEPSYMGRTGKAEFVELWEIHDLRSGSVVVVATGYDKFLRKEEDQLQVDGLPFVGLSFTPRARTFWTTSDAHYLMYPQAELSDISLQASKQRRMSVLKFLYAEGAMDESELEKVLSSEVGIAAKVKGGNNLKDAIYAFTPSTGNIFLHQEAEFARRTARENVGFSRNQMGEYEQAGRRTATEAMAVQEAHSQRMSRRHLLIRDFYLATLRKINHSIFKFWTTPRWIQVLGENGAMEWIQFRGSELSGEYKYDLEFFNESPLSTTSRRQQAIGMWQLFSQDPRFDQNALLGHLKESFNNPEFSSLIRGGDANLQLQMSQMQGQGGQVPQNQGPQQTP